MIEAGAILVSYGESYVNPEGAKNLNLYNLRQFNFWHYTLSVSFMVALPIMKSWVAPTYLYEISPPTAFPIATASANAIAGRPDE